MFSLDNMESSRSASRKAAPDLHISVTCVTCTYSSYISALLFLFYFILLYLLCKVVFIVTPGSIPRSLTVLSLVRRFGQKCRTKCKFNVTETHTQLNISKVCECVCVRVYVAPRHVSVSVCMCVYVCVFEAHVCVFACVCVCACVGEACVCTCVCVYVWHMCVKRKVPS